MAEIANKSLEAFETPRRGTGNGKRGRPLGRRNKITADVHDFVGEILHRINAKEVIRQLYVKPDGTQRELTDVSSRVLLRLMEYYYGKPQENIQMQVNVNLRDAVALARQRVIDAQVVETPLLAAGSGTNAESTTHLDDESLQDGKQ